jgi:hypothetical protein
LSSSTSEKAPIKRGPAAQNPDPSNQAVNNQQAPPPAAPALLPSRNLDTRGTRREISWRRIYTKKLDGTQSVCNVRDLVIGRPTALVVIFQLNFSKWKQILVEDCEYNEDRYDIYSCAAGMDPNQISKRQDWHSTLFKAMLIATPFYFEIRRKKRGRRLLWTHVPHQMLTFSSFAHCANW